MIFVTGADGFIGRVLCTALAGKGISVRAGVRQSTLSPETHFDPHLTTVTIGSINARTDWSTALAGVETVVHLAARTHAIRDDPADALNKYRQINVEGTKRLVRDAAACGVKRVIFMSSIKVNGERTFELPFTESDTPRPEDAYGISKWEAEQALAQAAKETGMEFVVLRTPLVYGPGVKGNFLRLVQLVARGVPLPLASVSNRRSLVYVGNLADVITLCIKAAAAAGNTYVVSDEGDVSTPQLIRTLAAALGVPDRLFPLPLPILKLGGTLAGKRMEIARLVESLQVNSAHIRNQLGWRPHLNFSEGVGLTAAWYKETVLSRRPSM